MNKNKLKVYAPRARKEFIKAITERAALYGITAKKIAPCEIKGDYAFISGKPFPKSTEKSRNGLIEKIESKGFTQIMEEVAYTWFNRFAAIRFMELNGYLSHGYRVLSHSEGHSEPEILEKAQYLEGLDGLEKKEIIALKTAGNKDAELYRKLIIAQCNELNSAMPFLFEKIDDPSELLLPDNLLNTDSVIRKMVEEIPEENWKEVEIIGWFYQFYISEKKDSLMKAKKAYKTEDIPAVTQRFTPNWIVKYLVQNSLGAKWLGTYPASSIKDKMEYYIEPAEQTDEVKQKLKNITPDLLSLEELTVMDPACGSGHILVEAYTILKEICLERGYRPKDIPSFILTKNLYGLEIDERAAQLAGFALMMKARQDDRHIFEKHIKPNIVCLKSANRMGTYFKEARELIELFDNVKTCGALIRVPEDIRDTLPQIKKIADEKKSGDLFEKKDTEIVIGLLRQAEILSRRFDCVIANPPYMGVKGMNVTLKKFAKTQYPATKSDLFAMFIERGFEMAKDRVGYNAMVTMQSWMFLTRYEKKRKMMFNIATIRNMVHMSNGVMGIAFGTSATVWIKEMFSKYNSSFSYVDYSDLIDGKIPKYFPIKNDRLKSASTDDFKKIPGSPIVYWVGETVHALFSNNRDSGRIIKPKVGLQSGNNDKYIRYWWEICLEKASFGLSDNEETIDLGKKWYPFNKGGDYRKWYGNLEFLVNWEKGGKEILSDRPKSVIRNQQYYFKESISCSAITSSIVSYRYYPKGGIFDVNFRSIFNDSTQILYSILGLLNSRVIKYFSDILSQTMALNVDDLNRIPIPEGILNNKDECVKELIVYAKKDWDSFETSWDFQAFPMLSEELKETTVKDSYVKRDKICADNIQKMKQLEEENNKLFIKAYGLQDELTPEVLEEEITLACAKKEDDIKRLISYSIGCMMGRYSLDKKGLIYAQSSNEGFDATQYKTFPADADGIIPITDHEWFEDDVACRFFKFIETAWDKKGLDINLDFIVEAIGRKSGESSRETIRRYFLNVFYKDHCNTYKKRPIYWLFTSGRAKAFQAIVYLHRYNEGTLSRMRTEYVLPLQTKIARYIENLEKDKDSASSTSAANMIQKEITVLLKQNDELIKFDEQLRHYADMKIKLDLDDGVKVNYGKFGDLLSNVKAIAGKKGEKA